ncbi:fatty-acyl-CoA synthase [Pseudonocardia ammonioxydans]|uniref:Fatty-acyl-CoA synthase n=1 Tax=Pseudonocardia ammonioxydans TaxID=260086 RepID=A0A1I5H1E1_PSUAM|nr:AMP-binding protein [Pseudonocardia ammonioxydans]SFO42084.1 fatty-acyl-CoA synthase [Pseudonocardia ammonioxydans]
MSALPSEVGTAVQHLEADTVPRMVVELAERYGSAEAVVDGPVRLGFDDLLARSVTAAQALLAAGVGPGARVAMLLPNGWRYGAIYLGTQLAGGVAVLVNTRLAGPEIAHILTDSGSDVLVTTAELAARLDTEHRPRVVVATEDLVATASPSLGMDLPGLERDASDIAQLLYTSGTTGKPKGAMQTHANLMFNAGTVRRLLGAAPRESTLIAAPMFHAIGIVSQWVGFLSGGARCVLVPTFEPRSVVRLLARERVTVFAGVASMLQLILLKARDEAADLSGLRSFVMGGSPVPASLDTEVARQMPWLKLANVWGLTEATSITTYTEGAEYRARPWSAGTAVAGVEVAVSTGGGPPGAPADTVGELCVRGPSVCPGYWANAEATAAVIADGWLHTGDVGSIDADGHVRVLDRLKDMVIRGGENVYSLEVENVLGTHPSVAEVAVIGLPDQVLGERVCAVVIPSPGAEPDAEALRVHAAGSLADYKVPTEVRFVAELPRNAAGKVLKRVLAGREGMTVPRPGR